MIKAWFEEGLNRFEGTLINFLDSSTHSMIKRECITLHRDAKLQERFNLNKWINIDWLLLGKKKLLEMSSVAENKRIIP